MGDKQPNTEKDKKKMIKNDDPILSDLDDDSRADIECDTCGVRFSNPNNYESHMQGKKHQKKVAEAKLIAKNLAAGTKENPECDEDEDDGEEEDLTCEVCDKHFSGYVSYVAHVKGSVHAKNVKKIKLKQQLGDMPEGLDKDGGDNSDDDGILPKPYARCNTCQKEFSGPEPYKMHLKSSVHKKKVKQNQAMQTLKAKYEDETKTSDDDEFFNKCDVCQKSFSGVVPYKIHMQSGVHKKSLEKKKVAEEIKEFRVVGDDSNTSYVCKECKKPFNDPVAFKAHLENNSHERRKAKSALLEFLDTYPEIVFVYALDKDENESDSDGGADSDYYLICKLCHVSFSGPESAQDHVKSKKHISVKKEIRVLKLLKEQKKKSDVDDKKSQNDKDEKPSAKRISDNVKHLNIESPENSHASNADDFELI